MSEGMPPYFPFPSREVQVEAYRQGAWLFLASEIMLFGGIFVAYVVGRIVHPEGFAEASSHLDLTLGVINTVILLTSSFCMAMAVESGHHDRRRAVVMWLLLVLVLGFGFLGIKGTEWMAEIGKGDVPGRAFLGQGAVVAGKGMFLWLYFTSTALHALHLTVGLLVLMMFVVAYARKKFDWPSDYLVMAGLYWHLVDLIWIFLFPLLYLVGGHP